MRPKVWIIKEQSVPGTGGSVPMDYSPALEYGDLEFITKTDIPVYDRSSFRDAWNADVCRFVERYDPLRDHIITTGQPVAIFGVGFALGRVNKAPRFLVWRREENRYRVMHLDPDFKYQDVPVPVPATVR